MNKNKNLGRFDRFSERIKKKIFRGYRFKLKGELPSIFRTVLSWKQSILDSADSISISLLKIPEKLNSIQKSQKIFNKNISKQLTLSQNLASSAEQLNASVSSISSELSYMKQIAESTRDQTEESDQNMNACVVNTESLTYDSETLRDSNKKTYAQLIEFKKSLDEIHSFLGDIKEIAEQTNIMSINISIEAAHAKDYGKGLSVIAKEIFNMALNSKDLLKSISKTVNDIHEKFDSWKYHTEHQIQFIDDIVNRIGNIKNEIQNNRQFFNSTKLGMNNLTEMISEIHGNLNEINQAAKYVADNAANLASNSDTLISANEGIQEDSDHIYQLIKESVNIITTQNSIWLYEFIRSRRSDHIKWVLSVDEAIQKNDPNLIPEINPRKCKMGLWYYSSVVTSFEQKEIHKKLEEPHRILHESARTIQEAIQRGDRTTARELYDELLNTFKKISKIFNEYEAYLEMKSLSRDI
ncbi:MAG: CZB domain-containing protein [Leptospiraceae bacterium]|nr:CZB domain-containing protein [Leptospiraceae bacterium]